MCRDALLSRAARALHSAPHGAYCFVAMFVDMVTILTPTVTQGMYFMDMLVDTVRDEIAECSEKAYPSIGAKELQCLLMMTTESQLSEFADGRGWNIDNGPSPSVVACDSHDSHDSRSCFPSVLRIVPSLSPRCGHFREHGRRAGAKGALDAAHPANPRIRQGA